MTLDSLMGRLISCFVMTAALLMTGCGSDYSAGGETGHTGGRGGRDGGHGGPPPGAAEPAASTAVPVQTTLTVRRQISQHLETNGVLEAGFVFTGIVETRPTREDIQHHPPFAFWARHAALCLGVRARKQ